MMKENVLFKKNGFLVKDKIIKQLIDNIEEDNRKAILIQNCLRVLCPVAHKQETFRASEQHWKNGAFLLSLLYARERWIIQAGSSYRTELWVLNKY